MGKNACLSFWQYQTSCMSKLYFGRIYFGEYWYEFSCPNHKNLLTTSFIKTFLSSLFLFSLAIFILINWLIFSTVLKVFDRKRLCTVLIEICHFWFSEWNHVDLIALRLRNELPSKCIILIKHRKISFLLHLVVFYFKVTQAKMVISCTIKYSE